MIERSPVFDFFSYAIMVIGLVVVVLPFWIVLVAGSQSLAEVARVPLNLWPSGHLFENIAVAWERADLGPKLINSMIVAVGVTVGTGALVGPFARLRPGARLGAEVHIGNFVEVKNSTLAKGAKANHLAYLGDATVGERVNYGAGSITANYDGAFKHKTVIEADVHVGSNCVLVAPVTIGAGGTVGGGSTITKSTPVGALSVARSKQVSIANWQRPQKIAKKPSNE